jgi:hypothetical protein
MSAGWTLRIVAKTTKKLLSRLISQSFTRTSSFIQNRSKAMLRSYDELIKRVPLVKHLVASGNAEVLEALYKNVRIL